MRRRLSVLLGFRHFGAFILRLWLTFLLCDALVRAGYPGAGAVVCVLWFLLEITR